MEVAQSPVPTIGCTAPHAVGRIILAIFGVMILLLMN